MATETTPTNGSYVTWRELKLALSPLEAGIEEIKTTVNVLHGDFFETVGERRERKRSVDVQHFWLLIIATLFSGAFAAILTLLISG